MKILIVRFSSLGDIILTTPVIEALSAKFPKAELFYVTKSAFADIVKTNPKVTKCFELRDQSLKEFAAEMHMRFDLVVDLHRSLRSKLLLRELDYERRVKVRKPYFKRWFLVFFKVNLFKNVIPITEQYLRTIASLGIEAKESRPAIHPSKPGKHKIKNWNEDKQTIAVAPGAKWFTKRWPLDHYIDLIGQIAKKWPSAQIVLLGGPDEVDMARKVNDFFGDKGHSPLIDLVGNLSILETAYVISKTNYLISNDSALVHLGSAFTGVYTIALFLSTVEEFGFVPFRASSTVLSQKLPCKPCDHKGRRRCPKEHFRCAYAISPDQVMAALVDVYEKP